MILEIRCVRHEMAIIILYDPPRKIFLSVGSRGSLKMAITIFRGGETGIRTLGGLLTLNGFQDRRLKPLSHLSMVTKFKIHIIKYKIVSFCLYFVFYSCGEGGIRTRGPV